MRVFSEKKQDILHKMTKISKKTGKKISFFGCLFILPALAPSEANRLYYHYIAPDENKFLH